LVLHVRLDCNQNCPGKSILIRSQIQQIL
jgi:hypothetical protein